MCDRLTVETCEFLFDFIDFSNLRMSQRNETVAIKNLVLKYFLENKREMKKFGKTIRLAEFEVDSEDEAQGKEWLKRADFKISRNIRLDFAYYKPSLIVSCYGVVFRRMSSYERVDAISSSKFVFSFLSLYSL